MEWIALFAAAAANTASANDEPHRDWGRVVALDMTVADATACIARGMQRKGPVLALPVEDGSDIDFTPGGFIGWGTPEAWLRFHVRAEGTRSTLRISYKMPVTKKLTTKYYNLVERQCLKLSPST